MLEQERNTNAVQAGFTSMLDPTTPYTGDTYFDALDTQSDRGVSPVSDGYRMAVQEEKVEAIDASVGEMVADPEVPDVIKEAIISGAHHKMSPDTIPAQVMEQTARLPENNATDARLIQKEMSANIWRNIDDYQRKKQGIRDAMNVDTNLSFTEHAGNFAAYLVPLMDNVAVSRTVKELSKDPVALSSYLLAGEGRKEMQEIAAAMTDDERLDFYSTVKGLLDSSTSYFGIEHDYSKREFLDLVFFDEEYTDGDRYFDNTMSVVDIATLGIAGKAMSFFKGIKGSKAAKTADDILMAEKVERDMVKSTVQENTPKSVADATNDDLARDMNRAIANDETEETAQALTGTSKAEAIADAANPEPSMPDGSIKNKVLFDDLTPEELASMERINERLAEGTVNVYTAKEITSATANKQNKLANVKGITSRTEMTTVEQTDTGAKIGMVYGTAKGGYVNAKTALRSAERALESQGVTAEDLTLLAKNTEGEYVPIKLEDAPEKGDFLVRMDYNYETQLADVTAWEKFGVQFNWLHAIRGQNLLVDWGSMIAPELHRTAQAKVDISAGMRDDLAVLGDRFKNTMHNLPKDRQVKVEQYINKANEEGTKFSPASLKADGFTDAEVEGIKSFRRFWDTQWFVKNQSDVRALRNEGQHIIENETTRLIGKPVKTPDISGTEEIFDAGTGNLKKFLTDNEMVAAVNSGEVIKLRFPMEIDGKVVRYAHSARNKPRSLEVGRDYVTPYREGYYSRQYKDPYFIEETVVGANGAKYTKAIATARNQKDVELYIARLLEDNAGGTYTFRKDVKDPIELRNLMDQIDNTMGRSNLKARGKKLEDASAVVNGLEESHMLTPEEAMMRSAGSVSRNAMMGEFLDASTKRLKSTYKDALDGSPGVTAKEHRSAKIMNEYNEFIKNGYIDTIDEASRASLRGIGEWIGKKDFKWAGKAEEAIRKAAEGVAGSPINFAKKTAFNAYIATNPLRQLSLAVFQTGQLTAFRPVWAATQMVPQMSAMWAIRSGNKLPKHLIKATGRSEDELRLMYKEWQKSGMSQSISNDNRVRTSLTDLAREKEWARHAKGIMQGAEGAWDTTLGAFQKVGFEAAEELILQSAWLAHYDKVRETKKALTASDFQNVAGQARTFTYSMNRAGDMKYNSNVMSVGMQFMQVPHKAITTMTSNRGLSGVERMRLAVFNLAVFGLPTKFVYDHLQPAVTDILGSDNVDPAAIEIMHTGLGAYALNSMAGMATGEESNVSFKNVAPADLEGLYALVTGAVETDVWKILEESPSWSAWGRIGEAVKASGRVLTGHNWEDKTDEGLTMIANEWLRISSGWGNVEKAQIALEYGKLYSATNVTRNESVSSFEAFAQALGFQTTDEVLKWAVIESDATAKKKRAKSVTNIMDQVAKDLYAQEVYADNPMLLVKIWSGTIAAIEPTADDFSTIKKHMRRWQGSPDKDVLGNAMKKLRMHEGMEKADSYIMMQNNPEMTEKWNAYKKVLTVDPEKDYDQW